MSDAYTKNFPVMANRDDDTLFSFRNLQRLPERAVQMPEIPDCIQSWRGKITYLVTELGDTINKFANEAQQILAEM